MIFLKLFFFEYTISCNEFINIIIYGYCKIYITIINIEEHLYLCNACT